MGLNKALAAGGTGPPSILRQHMSGIPDVPSPSQAVLQTANAALQTKIQTKMQPFLTAKGDLQTAQQRLQQSRSAAANAATVAQARYAKYITGVNQKNQTAVAQYNQHLLSSLQQYAPQYDAAVAQQNLQTAEQATNPRSYSNSTYNRATRPKSKLTRRCRLNYPLDRARGRLDKTAHALPCPL